MVDSVQVNEDFRLYTPEKVWFELHREKDACDVLVCMDDGTIYTALFAIIDYIKRQMEMNFQVTKDLEDTPEACYCVFDTPHIIVEELTRNNIEDTIDNLIALDIFENHFTRVTEHQDELQNTARTMNDGRRATQEIATVVISDVLLVQE
ncbi:MAG: hypothetical protein Q9P01_21265 [Anaerolineae bacterium]|nr:hypothetical protein [Anaerolineae bacterium]MDQ7037274.1 hypothetical protein [Anaerolineae bacterium]